MEFMSISNRAAKLIMLGYTVIVCGGETYIANKGSKIQVVRGETIEFDTSDKEYKGVVIRYFRIYNEEGAYELRINTIANDGENVNFHIYVLRDGAVESVNWQYGGIIIDSKIAESENYVYIIKNGVLDVREKGTQKTYSVSLARKVDYRMSNLIQKGYVVACGKDSVLVMNTHINFVENVAHKFNTLKQYGDYVLDIEEEEEFPFEQNDLDMLMDSEIKHFIDIDGELYKVVSKEENNGHLVLNGEHYLTTVNKSIRMFPKETRPMMKYRHESKLVHKWEIED